MQKRANVYLPKLIIELHLSEYSCRVNVLGRAGSFVAHKRFINLISLQGGQLSSGETGTTTPRQISGAIMFVLINDEEDYHHHDDDGDATKRHMPLMNWSCVCVCI